MGAFPGMINTDNLCMSCMKEIGSAKQCPHCGYYADAAQPAPYLTVRSVVANRYLIGKLLEHNGEGAGYIGWDLANRAPITIREFFPDAIAVRSPPHAAVTIMPGSERTYDDCLQSFLELWRKLARLRGLSALIGVIDIVEQNNTAYAISDYIEGISLREYLLLKSKTGSIPWDRARQLLMPVLSAVGILHSSGILHRGISPTTLLVGQDNKVWLSGFSISQARTARGDLSAQLYPGYAAIEQYGFEGQQGAWTDIYAFAGVLYRSLIGSDPIEATLRAANDRLMVPGQFAEQLPAYVIHALVNAMQIRPENRTRTVEQLRAELSASPAAAVAGETYSQRTAAQRAAVRAQTQQFPAVREREVPEKKAANPKKAQRLLALKAAGICFGAGLLLILLVGILFRGPISERFFPAETTTMPPPTVTSKQYEVPDWTADTLYTSIVENPLWNEKFNIKVDFVFSDKVASGIIISQSLKPGTMVDQGGELILTVSKGKEMVELPNYRGYKLEDVKDDLIERGFKYKELPQENDGTHVPGTIIAMNLPSGDGKKYERGTSVDIQTWGPLPSGSDETTEENGG